MPGEVASGEAGAEGENFDSAEEAEPEAAGESGESGESALRIRSSNVFSDLRHISVISGRRK